jgi:hypothetical protein
MTIPLFDLGKLRYQYREAFDSNTSYESNDVVSYGGNLYCYVYGIASSGTAPTVAAKWALMLQGFAFKGNFNAAIAYKVGEAVKYGSGLFVATADTAVGQLPSDASKWAVLATGIKFQGAYNPATAYVRDDVVVYGAASYISLGDTTGNLPTDPTKWTALATGVAFRGAYAPATAYHKGDVAIYGNSAYVAKQDTTGNTPTDTSNWDLFAPGSAYQGAYVGATLYKKGDIVTYGGNCYVALLDVTGVLPPADAAKWSLLVPGFAFAGAYSGATPYKVGQVVSYGAYLYLCIADATGAAPDVSPTYWSLFLTGMRYRNGWGTATGYLVGDVVTYGAGSWICTTAHTSSAAFPTDSARWSRLAAGLRYRGGWAANTVYLKDDVVTDGASSYIALADVTSATRPLTDFANWQTAMAGSDQNVAKSGDTMTGPLGLGGELNGGGNDYRNLNPKVQVVTATATVDITAAPIVVLDTPAAASQITFSGLPAPGHTAYWELEIVAPGANAITFGNTIVWDGGTQPTINTGSKTTILAFRARNKAGTTKIIGAASFGDIA